MENKKIISHIVSTFICLVFINKVYAMDVNSYNKLKIYSNKITSQLPSDWKIIEEKKKIKEFVVDLKKPYLGFCLGCQLLGEVVGGKVVKSKPAEIGIMDINFSKEKDQDKLFSEFPEKIKSLQWHSYEVQGIDNNKDVTLLASSPVTKYQIFKYQNHAYGIQFHIEVKDTTVNTWGCVAEYKSALEEQLGDGALEKFDKEAKLNMRQMNNCSKILYSKFKNEIIKV